MKKIITVIILWAAISACGKSTPGELQEFEDWRTLLTYDMSKDPDFLNF